MGSFPHEFPGYRHVSDAATRALFEARLGRAAAGRAGPAHSEHVRGGARRRVSRAVHQGEDLAQSDPNTQHVTAALRAMECVIVQDLFLNETAKLRACVPARFLLPRERRHLHERRAAHLARAQGHGAARGPGRLGGHAAARERARLPMNYAHPSEIMDEIARAHADLRRRELRALDRLGSIQWPCNAAHPTARRPCTSAASCAARAASSSPNTCRPPRQINAALSAAADDRTHPVAVQRRRADAAHGERRLARRGPRSRSIRTMPRSAGSRDGDWVGIRSRAGDTVLRAEVTDARSARRRLHDLPLSGIRRQRRHHGQLRLGDELPRIQGDGGPGRRA